MLPHQESGLTNCDLTELQAETLFRFDDRGRILSSNEPQSERQVGPLVFLGRTVAGNVWRFRHDLPAALVDELALLLRAEPVAESFAAAPGCLPALRAALARFAPVEREYRGPAYLLPPDATGSTPVPLVEIDSGNVDLLRSDFADWLATWAERSPFLAAVQDGKAVAVCCCARLGSRAAEASLHTLPAYRGRGARPARGQGSAVTAAWAAAVRQRGLLPLYSTSWDNLASQGVARRLGAQAYGEDLWLR